MFNNQLLIFTETKTEDLICPLYLISLYLWGRLWTKAETAVETSLCVGDLKSSWNHRLSVNLMIDVPQSTGRRQQRGAITDLITVEEARAGSDDTEAPSMLLIDAVSLRELKWYLTESFLTLLEHLEVMMSSPEDRHGTKRPASPADVSIIILTSQVRWC